MGHYLLKDAPMTGTGDLLISVQAVEPIKIPIIEQNSKDIAINMAADNTISSGSVVGVTPPKIIRSLCV